mmetsp:Transcript_13589/g.28080  ORF Transcript_13589/g.28080 Transcript_13589/m.28080 type:complete len:220 (-) Transcript_13589:126-785(-)
MPAAREFPRPNPPRLRLRNPPCLRLLSPPEVPPRFRLPCQPSLPHRFQLPIRPHFQLPIRLLPPHRIQLRDRLSLLHPHPCRRLLRPSLLHRFLLPCLRLSPRRFQPPCQLQNPHRFRPSLCPPTRPPCFQPEASGYARRLLHYSRQCLQQPPRFREPPHPRPSARLQLSPRTTTRPVEVLLEHRGSLRSWWVPWFGPHSWLGHKQQQQQQQHTAIRNS